MSEALFTAEDDAPLPGRMRPDDIEGPRPTGISQEDALDAEATEPTQEEQAQYQQAATMAFKFIHGQKSREIVQNALNVSNMPVHQAVGRMAAKIAHLIMNSAKTANAELAPEVVRELIAGEVIPELMDIGQESGFWDLSEQQADEEIKMAALAAAKAYGEGAKQRGELPTAEAQAFLESQGADLGELGGGDEYHGMNPVTAGVRRANQELFSG